MYRDKKNKDRLDLGERLAVSLGILGFNQGLIQFADAKANGLVVVNSIFLASMVPALEKLARPDASWGERAVAGVFFFVTVAAMLSSLWVTLARAPITDEPRPKSLLYYKHIASFSKAQSYVDDFRESDGEKVLDAVLTSNYDLAAIANAKFAHYKRAEKLTLVGAVLWVSGMVAVHVV